MYELCVWWIDEGDEGYSEFHGAALAWVESLGLDPSAMGPRAGVVKRGDQFFLLYDELNPASQRAGWEDPLYAEMIPDRSARRQIPVEPDSWPDRRRFNVPLWSLGRVAHVRLDEAAV